MASAWDTTSNKRHMRAVLPFLFACSTLVSTAQFHYTITSTPDSAIVLLNGKEKCATPCLVKYRWKDAENGKIVFQVTAPGHKAWNDSISSKPNEFDRRKYVHLDRQRTRFKFDTAAPLIAFDKLLAADFQDGRVIGSFTNKEGGQEALKWEGSVKIGERAFERKFYEVVNDMGFPISKNADPKLFEKTRSERPQMPRFVVGVKLVDYNITALHDPRPDHGAGSVTSRTSLDLEWQVLDRSTGKVVLTQTTTGTHKHRQRSAEGENLAAFEDALIEFLEQGELVELVRMSKGFYSASAEPMAEGTPAFHLDRPTIPEFSSLSEMIKYADRSCVTVITDEGHGSGVIINNEGHMLTSHHVIDGMNRIEVQFSDGLKQEARILAFDLPNDVALLDISGSGYRALPLGKGADAALGEEVITIGTPADLLLGQSVARGILSGKRKFEDLVYLQTDMAVSPGNSGGPLINSKGEVIGLVQGKIVSQGVEGISFATPIDRALQVLRIQISE